jgi:hypothetical protein
MVHRFKKPRINATVRETKCVHCSCTNIWIKTEMLTGKLTIFKIFSLSDNFVAYISFKSISKALLSFSRKEDKEKQN